MIDQLFDRDYQASRRALNADLVTLGKRFAWAFTNAFKVLNRIEYLEPWASARTGTRSK